ncbi:MAG: MFS transporter, partial [Asgard group archaeon]|nr:MFS transporter [Asgard group archaeon]
MKIPTKLSSKLREVFPPKNLLPLLFSYTVDHIALSTYWIFFAIWLSEKLTDSYMIISIVIAIPAVISVFGTAVFSSFSDKTGRRKELILFSRIALMTQYLFLIFFQNSVWIVLVILACFGLFTQIFYVMNSTLLTIICHPDRRGQVSSFQSVFASAGWMIGSFISGFIYENLGIIGCLSFAAGFAILSGIIAMFSPIKPSYDKEEDKISSISNPAVEFPQTDKIIVAERTSKTSYWDIFKRPQVLTLILTLAILEFGYGPFNVITSVYLKDIGLTDSMISINNTVATFIGMVTLLLIGKLLDQKG